MEKKNYAMRRFVGIVKDNLDKFEKEDSIEEEPVDHKNNYKIRNSKPAFFCFQCKNVLHSPYTCEDSCNKTFCEK